jgi:crotonobetainyl-CoA:carnitine CoA-transferase CaiB-like acyl-CoA transferase
LRDRERIEQILGDGVASQDAEGFAAQLRAAGVPAAAVCRSLRDAMNNYRLADNHIVWRNTADIGWIAMAQVPWHFDATHVTASWPCPPLGAPATEAPALLRNASNQK